MSYNNFNDLITDLIRQNHTQSAPSIENFNGEFYNELPISIPEFWSNLINYLKNEGNIGIRTSPIQEETFNLGSPAIVSVFNYINQKCDLDSIWNNLVNNIKEHIDLNTDAGVDSQCNNYFWNESVNKAVAIFLKTMDPTLAQIFLGKDRNNNDIFIGVNDVKNADAGWSFINRQTLPRWVKPYVNIDGDNYVDVRGIDAIESVLKNKNQLQFTNKQDKLDGVNADSWIRLLMPKYLRKVEVEDLNRNFWVIGQTLSAVCAYLFGDNSIENLFKSILNELMQLWENVLYLWSGIALISQKDIINDYIVQIVPIANSKEQGYIKFDNFGTTDKDCITYTNGVATVNWLIIQERVKHIAEQYNDVNLIIIPEIREGNYKHNYYYRVSYPGLLIYDANNAARNKKIDFQVSLSGQIVSGTSYPVIDLNYESNLQNYNYLDKIGSIYEAETKYNYRFPYSDIINTTQQLGEVLPYYALLRMIPNVNVTYDNSQDGFQLGTITFAFNDVSQELRATSTTTKVIDYTTDGQVANDTLTFSCTISNIPTTTESEDDIPIQKGYYLGELVSYQSILGLPTITIENETYAGQQLMFTTPEQAKYLMTGG